MTSLNDAVRRQSDATPAPLEFPPAIDPVFWGTGDLLTWDVANLLHSIDKKHLFRKIWALDTLSDKEYGRMVADVFEPAFDELSRLIIENELIVPRAFYGFFPVISDAASIVALDPSDFHSEIFSIMCPKVRMLGGRSLADFYRPEGDVLAISAVTVGASVDHHLHRLENDAAAMKKALFLRGIATLIVEMLDRRLINEVRRGLGIDTATGKAFPIESGIVDLDCVANIFAMLGFEDRLGIEASAPDRYTPAFTAVRLLAQHPLIHDFVHFGT